MMSFNIYDGFKILTIKYILFGSDAKIVLFSIDVNAQLK